MMKRVNRKGQDEEERTNEIITEEDIAQQALYAATASDGATSRSCALEPMVLASRLNSCTRKSSFLPTGSLEERIWRNWWTCGGRRSCGWNQGATTPR